jgi:hypothetical protein
MTDDKTSGIEPACSIIGKFGMSYRDLAKLLGCHHTTIWCWVHRDMGDGTAGQIPRRWWDRIINVANGLGITITYGDLIFGFKGEDFYE